MGLRELHQGLDKTVNQLPCKKIVALGHVVNRFAKQAHIVCPIPLANLAQYAGSVKSGF
jgi:hypothetical protein